jgi:hypothetical protein
VNQTNAAILGILAAGVLGGCVSGPLATEWKDATVKRFRAPAPDSSRLYVYRASAGESLYLQRRGIDGIHPSR